MRDGLPAGLAARRALRGLVPLAILVATACSDPRDRFASGERGASPPGRAPALPVAGPGRSTGIKECDDYLGVLEKCVKNTPEPGKAAMGQALKSARESYMRADVPAETKAAWASACKQAADSLAANPACH
ncbi:MAG: hypothetical protein HY744_03090 [Deltaproteobacteria bacterium]|nr:hypothetical protein [Deltaproteobacteria bacterium]